MLQRLAVSCSLRAIAARVATSCPPPPPARGSGAPCGRGRKQGQAEGSKDARTQGRKDARRRGARVARLRRGPRAAQLLDLCEHYSREPAARPAGVVSAPRPALGASQTIVGVRFGTCWLHAGWGRCWLCAQGGGGCWLCAQGGGGCLPVDVRRARGEADGSGALKGRREGGARSREVDVARNLRPKDPRRARHAPAAPVRGQTSRARGMERGGGGEWRPGRRAGVPTL